MGAAGEARVWHQTDISVSTPDFYSRLPAEVLYTRGYLRKEAGDTNKNFPSPRLAVKGHRDLPARLSAMLLTTPTQQIASTHDRVIRHHIRANWSFGLNVGF